MPGGVVGLALRLGETVEPGFQQHGLQAIVKGMSGRARQLGPADHQLRLSPLLPPERHAHPCNVMPPANQLRATSSTGSYRLGYQSTRVDKLARRQHRAMKILTKLGQPHAE